MAKNFKKGSIVVRITTEEFAGMNMGDMGTIMMDGMGRIKEYLGSSGQAGHSNSSLRLATDEEAQAFREGVKNIKDISKRKEHLIFN